MFFPEIFSEIYFLVYLASSRMHNPETGINDALAQCSAHLTFGNGNKAPGFTISVNIANYVNQHSNLDILRYATLRNLQIEGSPPQVFILFPYIKVDKHILHAICKNLIQLRIQDSYRGEKKSDKLTTTEITTNRKDERCRCELFHLISANDKFAEYRECKFYKILR